MKKTILFMACCIGLMFFASCKKGAPTISVITGAEYVNQNAEVYSGSPFAVGFEATGENLIQIMLTAEQDGSALFTDSQSLDNVANYSYTKTIIINTTGTVTIRGTVTDAKGKTATKSFDIHFNEKPNSKFIGHYEGDILVTGSVTANMGGEDIHENLENEPFATIVDITAGEGINDVVAAITISGETNEVNGTVNGNRIVFEAIDDTFTFNYPYQGFSIPIPIDMNYTINGTLNGNKLDIDGTCHGVCSLFSGELTDGILGGSLIKSN